MTDNESKGWEDEVIPEYSSIAVLNSDRVDGYEMVPAVDFIRDNFIPKAEVRKVVEGMRYEATPTHENIEAGMSPEIAREVNSVGRSYLLALSDLLRALHISDE